MLPLKVDHKEVPILATAVRLRPLEHTLAMVDTRHREPLPRMEDRHHPALSPPTTHPIKEAPHPHNRELRHQLRRTTLEIRNSFIKFESVNGTGVNSYSINLVL